MKDKCVFCKITNGETLAAVVFEDDGSLAFLDHRPLFPGRCLLVPKNHFETLGDLPKELIAPLFLAAQLLARAVELALDAEGSLVVLEHRVSKGVEHLHVDV